ncbi:SgcJ/EcaC family oxidoreductase [Bradyrhizobium erythrophlei]|uniref:SgcJ/EcaC family oxidoreductase n=1 Tax=Bradyrhizobium erythrophlei TaxID=1437360 RepID=UPI0035EDA8EB
MTAEAGRARADIAGIIEWMSLEWNAHDADGYAALFTNDANAVIINGDHQRGRHAIAEGHREIFTGIYRDSVIVSMIEQLRFLAPDIALVHLESRLDVATGPAAGVYRARPSLILVKTEAGWRITAFHNTLCADKGRVLATARAARAAWSLF